MCGSICVYVWMSGCSLGYLAVVFASLSPRAWTRCVGVARLVVNRSNSTMPSVDLMEEGADVLDQLTSTAACKQGFRRPWCTFLSCVMLTVLLFAAPSTLVSGADTTLRRVRRQASLFRPPPPPSPPPLPSPPHSPPPPPPPQAEARAVDAVGAVFPGAPQAEARAVDAVGAVDPGGAARVPESSPLIQGIIEAGFSRDQAREGLAAVAAKTKEDNLKVHSSCS